MTAIAEAKLGELIERAVTDVFTTMLGMEIQAEPGTTSHDSASAAHMGIVALIGFAGPWVGTGSFACTPSTACRIANGLLGAEHLAVEEDVLDAVAEMTNMILGNVKTELEEILGPMLLSVPTVIYGRNFSTRSPVKQSWTVAPFVLEGERIEVRVCLSENAEQDAIRPGFHIGYSLHV
jgi:chemotaxis protein CheX